MLERKWFRFAVVLGMAVGSVAVAQEKPVRLTFDVATIKLHDPNQNGFGGLKALPGGHGYTAVGVPVKLMISLMYKVPERQIKGGPDWMAQDRYDVEARVDGTYSLDDLHIMFQHLLEDRFGLKFHIETKDGPIYALTVDPSGLKMTENKKPQDYEIPMIPKGMGDFTGTRVPMGYFAWFLGQQLQQESRPVVDETGLTGFYDFKLQFMPMLPPDFPLDKLPPEAQNRPSIADAVRDQLGLRLTKQNGPVEYYAIDKLERPSAD
jgi:uncharacterized protein (TIGR03435 family)